MNVAVVTPPPVDGDLRSRLHAALIEAKQIAHRRRAGTFRDRRIANELVITTPKMYVAVPEAGGIRSGRAEGAGAICPNHDQGR